MSQLQDGEEGRKPEKTSSLIIVLVPSQTMYGLGVNPLRTTFIHKFELPRPI